MSTSVIQKEELIFNGQNKNKLRLADPDCFTFLGIKMVDDHQPTYGYKGCFRDAPDRVLRGFNKVTEFNDLEFCANTCYKKGKGSFFHLQPLITSIRGHSGNQRKGGRKSPQCSTLTGFYMTVFLSSYSKRVQKPIQSALFAVFCTKHC